MTGGGHVTRADRAEMEAELEELRAELADERAATLIAERQRDEAQEKLGIVEGERDELRGRIYAHRKAVWAQIGRYGSKFDRELWDALR